MQPAAIVMRPSSLILSSLPLPFETHAMGRQVHMCFMSVVYKKPFAEL